MKIKIPLYIILFKKLLLLYKKHMQKPLKLPYMVM